MTSVLPDLVNYSVIWTMYQVIHITLAIKIYNFQCH